MQRPNSVNLRPPIVSPATHLQTNQSKVKCAHALARGAATDPTELVDVMQSHSPTNVEFHHGLSESKGNDYDAAMAKVSSTLRAALQASKPSRYAISQETGIGESVLHQFLVNGNQLRSNNLDKLCIYFGLELNQIKGKKPRK